MVATESAGTHAVNGRDTAVPRGVHRDDVTAGGVGDLSAVEQLLDRADTMEWRAPELAAILGERAASLAEASGANALWVRAEATVVHAHVLLGHRASTVGRAVAALRAAEDAELPVIAAQVRTDLAVCARSVGAPLTGLAILRPVLTVSGLSTVRRATALCHLVGCLGTLGRKAELDRVLLEGDRLVAADATLDEDDKLMARGMIRLGVSAHRRRHGDTMGAADAARTGIGFLDRMADPSRDGGVARVRLVLELVCSLLDRGDGEPALEAAQSLFDEPERAAAVAPTAWLRAALATRVLLSNGAAESAATMLRDALYGVVRHDLDTVVARLWLELANVEERIGNPAEAVTCLHNARAAEQRYARARSQARAVLHGEFGSGEQAPVDLAEIVTSARPQQSVPAPAAGVPSAVGPASAHPAASQVAADAQRAGAVNGTPAGGRSPKSDVSTRADSAAVNGHQPVNGHGPQARNGATVAGGASSAAGSETSRSSDATTAAADRASTNEPAEAAAEATMVMPAIPRADGPPADRSTTAESNAPATAVSTTDTGDADTAPSATERSATEQSATEQAAPEQTETAQRAAEQRAPEQRAPEQRAPEQRAPEQRAPVRPATAHGVTDHTAADRESDAAVSHGAAETSTADLRVIGTAGTALSSADGTGTTAASGISDTPAADTPAVDAPAADAAESDQAAPRRAHTSAGETDSVADAVASGGSNAGDADTSSEHSSEPATPRKRRRRDVDHGSVTARSVLDRLGISPSRGGRRHAASSDSPDADNGGEAASSHRAADAGSSSPASPSSEASSSASPSTVDTRAGATRPAGADDPARSRSTESAAADVLDSGTAGASVEPILAAATASAPQVDDSTAILPAITDEPTIGPAATQTGTTGTGNDTADFGADARWAVDHGAGDHSGDRGAADHGTTDFSTTDFSTTDFSPAVDHSAGVGAEVGDGGFDPGITETGSSGSGIGAASESVADPWLPRVKLPPPLLPMEALAPEGEPGSGGDAAGAESDRTTTRGGAHLSATHALSGHEPVADSSTGASGASVTPARPTDIAPSSDAGRHTESATFPDSAFYDPRDDRTTATEPSASDSVPSEHEASGSTVPEPAAPEPTGWQPAAWQATSWQTTASDPSAPNFDTANSDTANSDTANSDTADPSTSASGTAGSGTSEPGPSEPGPSESARPESGVDEPAVSDTGVPDLPRHELPLDEPPEDAGLAELLARALAEHQVASGAALASTPGGDDRDGHAVGSGAGVNGRRRNGSAHARGHGGRHDR
ncbi:hypothetical protein FB384_003186 [Prauserella sediminis]|uniref:Uncharacterized protein n=1 Tax=Prauserella sediminis TaxID=577680 RepID=A0A839XK27_9PSEU|nr:hypothetical protein [Prauserella sediminis]MBB3664282.1 hypothetical protein [Prauserella sediminis]